MRIWLLAAVLLVAAGCGAYQFPGEAQSPSPSSGVVSGRVVSVPCAPVEQPGSTCAGRPVPNLELDYVGSQPTVTKAITDSSGNYAVDLAPGSYVVKIKTYMRLIKGPTTCTISTTLGSAAAAASKAGHAASASRPVTPSRSHISSLMCGASGFNSFTSVRTAESHSASRAPALCR